MEINNVLFFVLLGLVLGVLFVLMLLRDAILHSYPIYPAGRVVHQGGGVWAGLLVFALLCLLFFQKRPKNEDSARKPATMPKREASIKKAEIHQDSVISPLNNSVEAGGVEAVHTEFEPLIEVKEMLPNSFFSVQVSACENMEEAAYMLDKLKPLTNEVRLIGYDFSDSSLSYKALSGVFLSLKEARIFAARLKKKGQDSFVRSCEELEILLAP